MKLTSAKSAPAQNAPGSLPVTMRTRFLEHLSTCDIHVTEELLFICIHSFNAVVKLLCSR